jgi:hypothetical protein
MYAGLRAVRLSCYGTGFCALFVFVCRAADRAPAAPVWVILARCRRRLSRSHASLLCGGLRHSLSPTAPSRALSDSGVGPVGHLQLRAVAVGLPAARRYGCVHHVARGARPVRPCCCCCCCCCSCTDAFACRAMVPVLLRHNVETVVCELLVCAG